MIKEREGQIKEERKTEGRKRKEGRRGRNKSERNEGYQTETTEERALGNDLL